MAKREVYYIDTEAKPEVDEKEERAIALKPNEFMIYKMLERIANILGTRR